MSSLKICPRCGNENLDFKIFCGDCGEQLEKDRDEEPRFRKSRDGVDTIELSMKPLSLILSDSRIIGFIVLISPVIMTFLTFPIFFGLEEQGLVHPGIFYGFFLLISFELIFFIGTVLFNREWRIGKLDGGLRVILAIFLFFSLMPLLILGAAAVYGPFPTAVSYLAAFSIMLFVIWLLYFGWLREIDLTKLP